MSCEICSTMKDEQFIIGSLGKKASGYAGPGLWGWSKAGCGLFWNFWSVPHSWVSKGGNGQSVPCESGSDCVCSCSCISAHRACCSFRDGPVCLEWLWDGLGCFGRFPEPVPRFSRPGAPLFSVCPHTPWMTTGAVQAPPVTPQLKLAPVQTLQCHSLTPDLRFCQWISWPSYRWTEKQNPLMDTGKQARHRPDFVLCVTHSVPHRNFQQCHYF